MIFETQGRGQYPPKWLPYGVWAELNIKVEPEPDRLSKAAGVDHFFGVRVDHFSSVANRRARRWVSRAIA
jgi:hypothetical protein